MNRINIFKAMGDLIESGKSEPDELSMPKFKIKNIWSKNLHLFSPLLQVNLNKKIHNMVHQYNGPSNTIAEPHDPFPDNTNATINRDFAIENYRYQPERLDLYRTICKLGLTLVPGPRKYAQVLCFGCILNKNRRDTTAAKAIAEALEPLAQQGYIKGSLSTLSKMRVMDKEDSTTSSRKIIMCYVAITDLGEAYLKANPTELKFLEGGMPYKLP